MSGRELYEAYLRQLLAVQDCTADSWEELPPEERQTWDALAEDVFPYPDPTLDD